jgi:hypothetical protein
MLGVKDIPKTPLPLRGGRVRVGVALSRQACLREGRLRAEALRWRRPALAKAREKRGHSSPHQSRGILAYFKKF